MIFEYCGVCIRADRNYVGYSDEEIFQFGFVNFWFLVLFHTNNKQTHHHIYTSHTVYVYVGFYDSDKRVKFIEKTNSSIIKMFSIKITNTTSKILKICIYTPRWIWDIFEFSKIDFRNSKLISKIPNSKLENGWHFYQSEKYKNLF